MESGCWAWAVPLGPETPRTRPLLERRAQDGAGGPCLNRGQRNVEAPEAQLGGFLGDVPKPAIRHRILRGWHFFECSQGISIAYTPPTESFFDISWRSPNCSHAHCDS